MSWYCTVHCNTESYLCIFRHPDIKRTICKKCCMLLLPGITSICRNKSKYWGSRTVHPQTIRLCTVHPKHCLPPGQFTPRNRLDHLSLGLFTLRPFAHCLHLLCMCVCMHTHVHTHTHTHMHTHPVHTRIHCLNCVEYIFS